MRAFDRERWRGGTNTGFVLWLNARAAEFTQGVPGRDWADRLRKVDPDAFDAYLRSFAADLTLGLVP